MAEPLTGAFSSALRDNIIEDVVEPIVDTLYGESLCTQNPQTFWRWVF